MTGAQPSTRIEWCGNIQVHHPIRPTTVHATAKEFAVMSA